MGSSLLLIECDARQVVLSNSETPGSGFYSCTTAVTPTFVDGAYTERTAGPHFAGNTFIAPNGSLSLDSEFPQQGCSKKVSFKQWQAKGFDAGSSVSSAPLTPAALVAMAVAKLPLLREL